MESFLIILFFGIIWEIMALTGSYSWSVYLSIKNYVNLSKYQLLTLLTLSDLKIQRRMIWRELIVFHSAVKWAYRDLSFSCIFVVFCFVLFCFETGFWCVSWGGLNFSIELKPALISNSGSSCLSLLSAYTSYLSHG